MNPFYKDYAEYIAEIFPDFKVQKLSVDAGFSCPNRDGTIGRGGCIYCNNTSFTPAYCSGSDAVARQLEEGKHFFSRKYPDMKYLAYFQSYTNTYGRDISLLRNLYEEALAVEGVVGLIVGTRPDALPDNVLDMLSGIAARVPVFVEIGAESCHDDTLRLINRGHTWQCVEDTVRRCAAAGLHVGLHLICGLPGESEADMLLTTDRAVALPVETLKFHQLQVIRDTVLSRRLEEGDKEITPTLFTSEEYLDLCVRIISRVPRHIAIERFLASAPPEMVIAPRWGLKNYQFVNALLRRLQTASSAMPDS